MAKYYFGNHKAIVYHSNYLIAEVITALWKHRNGSDNQNGSQTNKKLLCGREVDR